MLTNPRSLTPSVNFGLVLMLAWSIPDTAPAAPGNPAQTPLYVSTSVKPNVFLVLDDSNTMQYTIIRSAGALAAHPRHTVNFATNLPDTDPLTLALCPGYNALAYDPQVTYTPWHGTDSAGNAYRDRTLLTACANPYDASTCNLNLGDWIYFSWDDRDRDGDYDLGECPRPYAATGSGVGITPLVCAGIPGCVSAANATAPSGVNGATNFANWYTYYRMRDRILKGAASEIIDASELRVGLASLLNRGEPATPVSDLGDTTSASDCGAGRTNKACLLDRLFNMVPDGDTTPLRLALDQAGHYFNQNDNGLGHEFLRGEPSPILEEGGNCQQNFLILITDGAWTLPDWPTEAPWTYGDADGDNDSPPWDGGSHADASNAQRTCTFGGFLTYSGQVFDTLADVAMQYYEQDLSPLDNDVPIIPGRDENSQQHLVTFTVAFGVDGTLANDPPNRTDPFPWPPVCYGGPEAIDDLRHAAWNGRGSFLSAKSPGSLSQGLRDALGVMAQLPAGTGAALAFNTGTLTTDTLVFQAQFDTRDWSGELLALDVDPETGDVDQDNPVWRATTWLDTAAAADRLILTKGASDGALLTSANWNNLSTAQQDDLRTNSAGAQESAAAGLARLEYLRGDSSCQAPAGCAVDVNGDGDASDPGDVLRLRTRTSRLGDIVHGGPIVVGAPALNWPSAGTTFFPTAAGSTYAEFKSANAGRTPVVYVGANDGMLHGFKATANGGQELIAYVPTALSSTAVGEGLHRLSETTYNHRFYVDRTPSISDVYIDSTGGGTRSWRTTAVGGLGAGGRGLFALDVTDPNRFTAANAASLVLWEFTSADDAELGYTYSQPIIAMMNNGEWAAIVGSGYEDSGTNEAHLYVLFLEGGVDGVWTAGSDYVRIEATLGSGASPLRDRNGLSSPAVADLDRNGTADRVYVGDLLGNLWAFDVSGRTPDAWTRDNLAPRPLFTATDADGLPQPITAKPEISKHPTVTDVVGGASDNQPNVMVYFGTGQYLADTDKLTRDEQSFYGIWDRNDFGLTRDDLQEQRFLEPYGNLVVTDEPVDWAGEPPAEYGWYLNLPDSGPDPDSDLGERVVTNAVLRGGVVFFNSLVPSASPCQAGGSGFLYAVDMDNGGRPDAPPFDNNGDGVLNLADRASGDDGPKVATRFGFGPTFGIPSPSTIIGNQLHTAGTSGELSKIDIAELTGLDIGRLSWQHLYRN